jgi:hypothetical protein
MDMDTMRLVRDRGQQRALVNMVIIPGFHKGRIFHTQLGNYQLLAGDYTARVIIRKNTSELTDVTVLRYRQHCEVRRQATWFSARRIVQVE